MKIKKAAEASNRTFRQSLPGRGGQPEIVHKAHQRVVRKRLIILAVLAALAAIAALVLFRYERYHTFTDYQTVWERIQWLRPRKPLPRGKELLRVQGFRGRSSQIVPRMGYLSWTSRGKVVWVQSYEMRSPVVSGQRRLWPLGTSRAKASTYAIKRDPGPGRHRCCPYIEGYDVRHRAWWLAPQEDSTRQLSIYLYKRMEALWTSSSKVSAVLGDRPPVDLSLSAKWQAAYQSYMYLDQGVIKCKMYFTILAWVKMIPTTCGV